MITVISQISLIATLSLSSLSGNICSALNLKAGCGECTFDGSVPGRYVVGYCVPCS